MKKLLLFAVLSAYCSFPAFSNVYGIWVTEPSGVTISSGSAITVKSGQSFRLSGFYEYGPYKWFGEELPESGVPFDDLITVSNSGTTDIVRVYRVYRIPATGDPISTEYIITATIKPEQGVGEPAITNNVYCSSNAVLTAANCSGTVKWYKVSGSWSSVIKSVVPGADMAAFEPGENGTYCATCTVGGSESFGGNTIAYSTASGVQPYITQPGSNITACMWSEHSLEATGIGLEAGTVTWYEKVGSGAFQEIGTGASKEVTVPDLATQYYARLSIPGCSDKNSNTRTINVQLPTAVADASENTITAHSNFNIIGTGDCKLIAGFQPNINWSDVNVMLGKQLLVKVSRDNSVQLFNGQPYVQRHFDFEPLDALTDHPYYSVRLYFTQADFDAFNAASTVKLPENPEDKEGYLANLRIWQVHGTPTGTPATPGNYTGGEPTGYAWQAAVSTSWNSTLSLWEVHFNTNGFSGFFITTEGATPLPVSLADFTAQKLETGVQLRWQTTEETNSDRFDVLHSQDGQTWDAIGSVASSGEHKTLKTYHHLHLYPKAGTNYYRLKMIDLDGSSAFSNITAVDWATKKTEVTLYPNPASDRLMASINKQAESYEIISSLGQVVRKGKLSNGSIHDIQVKDLPSGIYNLRLQEKDGSRTMRRFVVE